MLNGTSSLRKKDDANLLKDALTKSPKSVSFGTGTPASASSSSLSLNGQSNKKVPNQPLNNEPSTVSSVLLGFVNLIKLMLSILIIQPGYLLLYACVSCVHIPFYLISGFRLDVMSKFNAFIEELFIGGADASYFAPAIFWPVFLNRTKLVLSVLILQPIYFLLYAIVSCVHTALYIFSASWFSLMPKFNSLLKRLFLGEDTDTLSYLAPAVFWSEDLRKKVHDFLIPIINAADLAFSILMYSFTVFMKDFYSSNLGFVYALVNLPALFLGTFRLISLTVKAWRETYDIFMKDQEYAGHFKSKIADIGNVWLDWLFNVLAKGASLGLVITNLFNILAYEGVWTATSAALSAVGPLVSVFSQLILVGGATVLFAYWGIRSAVSYFDKKAYRQAMKDAKHNDPGNAGTRNEAAKQMIKEILHSHKCGLDRSKRAKTLCLNALVAYCIIGAGFVKFFACLGVIITNPLLISVLGIGGLALPIVIGLWLANFLDQVFAIRASYHDDAKGYTFWKDSIFSLSSGLVTKVSVGLAILLVFAVFAHLAVHPIMIPGIIACGVAYAVCSCLLAVFNGIITHQSQNYVKAKEILPTEAELQSKETTLHAYLAEKFQQSVAYCANKWQGLNDTGERIAGKDEKAGRDDLSDHPELEAYKVYKKESLKWSWGIIRFWQPKEQVVADEPTESRSPEFPPATPAINV